MSETWLGLMDKVCVVTGAIGGMGTKICEALANQGAKVVALDMKQAAVSAFATKLATTYHTETLAVSTNVTDEASVKSAVQQVQAKFGRVDVVILSLIHI